MRRSLAAVAVVAAFAVAVPTTVAATRHAPATGRAVAGRLGGHRAGAAATLKGTLKVNMSQALAGWTIVVDPGHGRDPLNGTYTGAMGVNGVSEDQNVLDIGRDLAALLKSEGATVYLTRGAYDPGPPPVQGLIKRVALAEQVHANLFISIHQNDGSARDHGVETFYDTPASLALAEDVQREMTAVTGLTNLGVHRQGFYVLRQTTMPAVLVEGGFLSNPSEARLISSAAFHQEEAQALNQAILLYAQQH